MDCFKIISIQGKKGEVIEIDLGDSFNRKLTEITSIAFTIGKELSSMIDFPTHHECPEKKTLSKL